MVTNAKLYIRKEKLTKRTLPKPKKKDLEKKSVGIPRESGDTTCLGIGLCNVSNEKRKQKDSTFRLMSQRGAGYLKDIERISRYREEKLGGTYCDDHDRWDGKSEGALQRGGRPLKRGESYSIKEGTTGRRGQKEMWGILGGSDKKSLQRRWREKFARETRRGEINQ